MRISTRSFLLIAAGAVAVSVVLGDTASVEQVVATAAIYAIAVLGADLFVSVAGQPSLGHGAFMAFGAYSTAITTVRYDWPPMAGVLLGIALSVTVAALLGSALLRAQPYHLAIATLAVVLGFQAITIAASEFTGGSGGMPGIPDFSIFGLTASESLHYTLVAMVPLILCTIYLNNVLHSPAGASLRASHLDETGAATLGVPTLRLKFWALLWSAGLASISGSLLAHSINFVSPGQFGVLLSIELLIMIALAGGALLTGALVGALMWGVVEEVTSPFPDLRLLLTGLVLWVVIMRVSSSRSFSLRGVMAHAGVAWRRSTVRDADAVREGASR